MLLSQLIDDFRSVRLFASKDSACLYGHGQSDSKCAIYPQFNGKLKSALSIVCLVTFAPLLLNFLGVDFSLNLLFFWSAHIVASFAALLAFACYYASRQQAAAIIGLVLFSAGLTEAFHALLATDRLIETEIATDNNKRAHFTWVIGRLLHTLILISGIWLCLLANHRKLSRYNTHFVVFIVCIVGLAAHQLMCYTDTLAALPYGLFSGTLIECLWDISPLIAYAVIAKLGLKLYHQHKSTLCYALLLSLIPETVAQLHMAFGSTVPFDNHFTIAHFLKLTSCSILLAGLVVEYIANYHQSLLDKIELAAINLQVKQVVADKESIAIQAADLTRHNQELEEFAYVVSHDLKTPLRNINDLSMYLEEDLSDYLQSPTANPEVKKSIRRLHSQTLRMNNTISGLLKYACVGIHALELQEVNLRETIIEIARDLHLADKQLQVTTELPTFTTNEVFLEQIFSNLFSNAVKYHQDRDNLVITVSCIEDKNYYRFAVGDNGPGIEPCFHEQIFHAFQTLQPRDSVESTGIGLAIVRKVLNIYGCNITIDSEPGRGANFIFTWPKVIQCEQKQA